MKKFFGNVNGKNFENEAEFLKAAEEAMKKGENNFSIASCYYTSDEKDNEPVQKPIEDPKFVSAHEYFLSGRNPDSDTENGIEYKVSDELKTRIIEASNRDDIKKSVTFHLNKLEDNIDVEERHIKKIQEHIDTLKKSIAVETQGLNDENDKLNDLKARDIYYTTLLNIIEEQESKEKEEEAKKKEEEPVNEAGPSNEEKTETTDLKKKIQEEVKGKSVSSFLDMSALDFLKQLGFIK